MINLRNETVISLTRAATLLPRRRAGKKVHVATLYRWASAGCRGVQLETIRVGGTLCTSEEAIQRFCERLTTGKTVSRHEPSRQRAQAIARAEAELDRAGIK